MSATTTQPSRRGRIGEAVRRHDAIPKVTGEFAYSSDLHAAGMLWGHTVRSSHPHARVIAVDISDARALPGVHAVLTHEDVPGQKTYGLEFPDQPVLAVDCVRYFGEAVAIVAAEEPEQARRAAAAVRVEYELLDPVVDPERATEQEPLHPDRPTMGHGYRDDPRPNVVRSLVIRRGDPDAEGDVTVSGVYEIGQQDQAFLGPESGLAVPDGEGGVDVYVATQWLHVDRDQVAPCLDLDPEQVRIHLAGVGGAFGGREDLSIQVHAAMLALRTGRAVKMSTAARSPSSVTSTAIRRASGPSTARSATGELVAVRMRLLLDGGAYASSSTAVISNACAFAVGPYAVENVLVDGLVVYTNNPPCGAMRGFGAVQSCVAAEAQMDRLAAALDIDPVELRLLNALEPGGSLPTGQVIAGSLPTREVIRRAASIPLPEPEELPRDVIRLPGGAGNTTRGEGVRRGVGFAVGFKNICYSEGFDDSCAARVLLGADGRSATIHCAAAEVGQGVTDVVLQVARHGARDRRRRARDRLHGARRLVGLVVGVADDVDGGGRRPARMPRGARRAGAHGRRRGRRRARLSPPAHVRARPRDGSGHGRARARRVRRVGDARRRRGGRRPRAHPGRLDRHRAGRRRAVNPLAVAGQIEGGTAQGLGLALMEEIQVRDGVIANASFTDYLIPTFLDMPPVVSELIEEPEPDAPYGVKGVGEPPTVVSTAAILSAVRDATGRELSRVPVRPDDIVGL